MARDTEITEVEETRDAALASAPIAAEAEGAD